MTDARRPDLGPRARIITHPKHPRCRGYCEGQRGHVTESPAVQATAWNGTRGLFCTCCQDWLRPVSLKDYAEDVSAARFAPDVKATSATLYECPRCYYNHQLIRELVPR